MMKNTVLKVFFWNVGQFNVDIHLINAINQMNVDLLVLAEFNQEDSDLLELINHDEMIFERIPQIGCKRISIFYRSGLLEIEHGPESSYYTTKKITLDNDNTFLMVAVHLPSKLNQNLTTQTLEAAEFKSEIEYAEETLATDKTFIVGDFNMNPFEDGMVSASAFHSVPCRRVASLQSRKIKKREHKFFYNPMWNLFGDLDDTPGTFFHRNSEQTVYFWNILDQVILRPSLMNYFNYKELKILKTINDNCLVSDQNRPNVSDHLPIVFELNFEGEAEDEEFMA
jgi:hypothetical protein